jgi:drug/metabolite transporter (DMT)-like permease
VSLANISRLILLSAIWGASFIFMRVIAQTLGVFRTADFRILLGGAALILYLWILKKDLKIGLSWKRYLFIGIVNTAIPFTLYAYAATTIPASYSAILNSSAPIFGTIFSAVMLSEKITIIRVVGLIVGVAGVCLMSLTGPVELSRANVLAMGACVLATVFYGYGSVYVRRYCKDLQPSSIAACSQFLVGILMLPLIFTDQREVIYDSKIVFNLLGLGLLCGSVAFFI